MFNAAANADRFIEVLWGDAEGSGASPFTTWEIIDEAVSDWTSTGNDYGSQTIDDAEADAADAVDAIDGAVIWDGNRCTEVGCERAPEYLDSDVSPDDAYLCRYCEESVSKMLGGAA